MSPVRFPVIQLSPVRFLVIQMSSVRKPHILIVSGKIYSHSSVNGKISLIQMSPVRKSHILIVSGNSSSHTHAHSANKEGLFSGSS